MAVQLVVGADGLIGDAIARELERRGGSVVVRTTRRATSAANVLQLDLAKAARERSHIADLVTALPTPHLQRVTAFVTAAVTGFQRCEEDPVESRLVNVVGTAALAEALVQVGAFVVFLSSNAVFSGQHPLRGEDHQPDPVTEYGRQKADAERRLLSIRAGQGAAGPVAVVRLTKVLSPRQPLVGGWLDRLRRSEPVEAATDLWMSPISLLYAVRGIVRAGDTSLAGVYHLSGVQDSSYFEFAAALALRVRSSPALVRPTAIREQLGAVPSPTFGALSMALTRKRIGIEAQPLANVADDMVADFGGPSTAEPMRGVR